MKVALEMALNSTVNTRLEREELCLLAEEHHKDQLTLCDQLEGIADSLPNQVDTQECLIASQRIYRLIKEGHRFEESKLFPILIEENEPQASLEEKLERLKFEHWEDESLAEDISEALRQYVCDPKAEMCEKLGYMLRGFFGNLRRHIAFEAEFILPQLKSV